MSPKIFPVIKKTVIQEVVGGSGPNPSDAFSIGLRLAESNTVPADAMSVAYTFPELIAAQADAVSFRLSFPETAPAQVDALGQLRMIVADTNGALSDSPAFTIRPTYGDTNAAPTDTFSPRLQLSETNAAPTDGRSATLTWTQGATTATQTGNWTNPANAQGTNNGTNATLSDAATNSNAGTLSLSAYPDAPADLQTWTVISVRLFSYHAVTGWTGVGNQLLIQYDVGAGFVTAATITANENFASTPRQFDLGALTWTQINALQVQFAYTAGLIANAATINVDAVHLQVQASRNPL